MSVIGDDSENIRSEIMSNINSLSYQMDIDDAIHIACASTLKRYINDGASPFVGGGIQGAILERHLGSYLVVEGEEVYFRGAELETWESLKYPVLDLRS